MAMMHLKEVPVDEMHKMPDDMFAFYIRVYCNHNYGTGIITLSKAKEMYEKYPEYFEFKTYKTDKDELQNPEVIEWLEQLLRDAKKSNENSKNGKSEGFARFFK